MRKVHLGTALGAVASSLTLAAALALPASAAATTGAAPIHAGPAASGAEVAAGSVISASGAAMPGATVDLYAWPSDAVVHAMKPGQTVPTTLLASTTTSSSGGYTLSVPTAKLKTAPTESGFVNMEISSPAGGFFYFPYKPGSLTPQKADIQVDSRLSCGKDSRGNPYGFTGFQLQRQRSPANAIVGQGYILKSPLTAGDSMSFKYTQGSSHSQGTTLGVGVSGAGSSVGYTSQGTHESTASSVETYPSESHGALFRTKFNTEQLRGLCLGPAGVPVPHAHQHGKCPRKYNRDTWVLKCLWEIAPSTHFEDESVVLGTTAPKTPRRYCGHVLPGGSYSRDRGTAVRWSTGFELGPALNLKGVNLKASFNSSAQTGYDDNAFMKFSVSKHQKHSGILCGTNRSPDYAAQLVMRGTQP